MLFELRHYAAAPGRGEALRRRFTDHTFSIFQASGFILKDFWQETARPGHFWYLLEWRDEAERRDGWKRLRENAAWQEIKAASEANGPLIASIESTLLERPMRDAGQP